MGAPDDAARLRPARWVPAATFAVAALVAAAFHFHTRFVNDDALITIRCAENMARGEGLVYNAGEPVLGTTTPLWAMLLAGFAALGADPVAWAVALGIAAHGAAAALTSVLFRRRGACALAQFTAGTLVALVPASLEFAASGMETALCVAWIAAFLVLFEAERWRWLGVVGGLALLTRPDAGLLLAAAAVLQTARSRSPRALIHALPGFAAVTLPWVVGAALYYGSPLPNSGFAKRLQVDDWGPYAVRLGKSLWDAAPLLPFALLGAWACIAARARLLPLAGALAIAVGMQAGGMPGCGWYVPPVLYLVAVLAADGAIVVGSRLTAAGPSRLGTVALAAPLLVAARLPSLAHDTQLAQAGLERFHATVGGWLRDHAPPGVSVGVDNIGYIGRVSGLPVVDMLGLVQPDTAEAIGRAIAAGEKRDYAVRHRLPEMVAAWQGRGNTWKYLPPEAWLTQHGYRRVFAVPLRDENPAGPAYVVLSRVPLRMP